jgi:hypothetical protein
VTAKAGIPMTSFVLRVTMALLLFLGLAHRGASPAAAAAATPLRPSANVDIALVLAVDVSLSVNYREAELQRDGIVAAFTSREVMAAIQSGIYRQIGVAVVFFSSADYGVMTVPVEWMVVRDEASAKEFARRLTAAFRPSGTGTSISDALRLAQELFERLPYAATKRVIDISGDGGNNSGSDVLPVRDDTLAKGITINGLAILEGATVRDLDRYYASCVIGGPGAFAMAAETFTDFARAMRRKLVLELSSLPTEGALVQRAMAAPPRQLPPAGGFLPPSPTPYPGGCEFPMFQ